MHHSFRIIRSLNFKKSVEWQISRIWNDNSGDPGERTFVDVVTDFCDDQGVLRATSTMRAIEFPEEAS